MNKIKIAISALCMTVLSTAAFSEMRIGVSAALMAISSTGSETLRDSNNVTNKSIDKDVVVPSLFLEVMNENGVAVGLDYVPVAELGSGKRANDDAETSANSTAGAELTSHVTLYVMKENDSGFFIKGGVAFADVDTTEKLGTGDSYGNTDTTGYMIGVGVNRALGDFFGRASLSFTDYDEVSVTSTGGSKVKADVDQSALTFSIGKAF